MADDTRLRILNLMLQNCNSLCVCEIVDALQLPQYQISRHLSILKNADLVLVTRKGTWAYYGLVQDEEFVRGLWQLLGRFLSDELFTRDVAQLELRLTLRAAGECVVGNVALDELAGRESRPRAALDNHSVTVNPRRSR